MTRQNTGAEGQSAGRKTPASIQRCAQCGSTLSTDAAGDLVCDVGTQANPKQACINACNPCSTSYQSCASSASQSTGLTTTRTGCCASILLAGLAGLFVFADRKEN